MNKKIFLGGTAYPVGKETVYIGSVRKTKLKTPVVRVTVSRGKTYDPNKKISTQEDAVKIFREHLTRNNIETQEKFLVIYTGRQNQVLGIYPHSIGGTSMTVAETKLIVKTALDLAADGVITCHNHPSGALQPSQPDLAMVKRLKTALEYYGISLLDNIILTKSGFSSY
jgi:DNA repair protein RadC